MTTSPEQTMPEPADGHAVLWPPRAGDEMPVLIWRSDQLAEDLGIPEDRWHTPNNPGPSTTWAEACRIADANDCPMSEAVVLVPRAAVEEAVAAARRTAGLTFVGEHLMEPGGYCRTHGVHHSPEELARAEDRLDEGEGHG